MAFTCEYTNRAAMAIREFWWTQCESLKSHHEPTTVSSTIEPKASPSTEAKRARLAKRLGVAARNRNYDYNTSTE